MSDTVPPRFSFVSLSSSRSTPRPTVRGLMANASSLPPGTLGWSVPDAIDGRYAPPESALALMEAGACDPAEREAAVSLAEKFRAAIAAGHPQADDATSEKQVFDCVGAYFAQAHS